MAFIINPFFSALPPFPPDSLAGLVRWYKADSFSLADSDDIGGAGREWIDQSVSGEDAVQATSGNRPVYRTNIFGSMPAIQFASATEQFLSMTGVTFAAGLTIIAVGKAVSNSTILGHSSNIWFRIKIADTNIDSNMGGVVVPSDVFTGAANASNMFSWRRDGAAVMSFRERNISRGDVADGAGLVSATYTLIGGTTGIGIANCHLGELCVYTQRHSDADIDLLYTNYFKPRWGLA